MISTMVNIYQVTVTFDAGNLVSPFSFGGDMINLVLPISPGINLIQLTLTTTNNPSNLQAAFTRTAVTNFPIQFNFSASFPPRTEVTWPMNYAPNIWYDDTHCTLVAINTNNSSTPDGHQFIVTVSYDGRTHTSGDPTIINEPPAGPPY
jgi:hypothetical protein